MTSTEYCLSSKDSNEMFASLLQIALTFGTLSTLLVIQ